MRPPSELPHARLRRQVRELCLDFPDAYWRQMDRERIYPEAFVRALTDSGLLAALIPEEYGGMGLGIGEASVILEEIHRSGGHGAACHAQMYTMGTLLRHGSPAQKEQVLPELAQGRLRLQAFSVTEPEAGSDTPQIRTFARREGAGYVVTGHKNWTSRIEESDLLMLLARTTPRGECARRTDGLSLFLVDLRAVRARHPESLVVTPVRTLFNYATYQVHYREMPIPLESRIGEEGQGFRYVLDGWNAERILLAAECIGDGDWFVDRAVAYANSTQRFGAPLSRNQGVQFPIARAYAQVRAADALRYAAAAAFDDGRPCGEEANMAKLLASEASWAAANACLDTHGGNGFVDEYDVERKFRESRLYQVAPVGNNLVLAYLATHVLGMARSY